jgi:hypothetical protein
MSTVRNFATVEELLAALPERQKICEVAEAVLHIPNGDPETSRHIIGGVDHPYASGSDVHAEVTAWRGGEEATRLAALAKARGGTLRFRVRPRYDALQRELAALRRAHRASLYGE